MPAQEITVSLQWDGSLMNAQNIVTVINGLFRKAENPAELMVKDGQPTIVLQVDNASADLTQANKVTITKNSHVTMNVHEKNFY